MSRLAEAERLGLPKPKPRPISAVLTNRLAEAGDLERTRLGALTDTVRNETRIGQALDAFGGARFAAVGADGRQARPTVEGVDARPGQAEHAGRVVRSRVFELFNKYEGVYPFLSQKAKGAEAEAARADFVATLERDPSKLDPGFVADYAKLQDDFARFGQDQGLLDLHHGEWHPWDVAQALRKQEARLTHGQRMVAFYNEYINPSGTLTADHFRAMADDVASIADPKTRLEAALALENTLDAYGIDPALLRGERNLTVKTWADWRAKLDGILNDPATTLTPRASESDIIARLHAIGKPETDRQATLLEAAVKNGDRAEVTRRLKNLQGRRLGHRLRFR